MTRPTHRTNIQCWTLPPCERLAVISYSLYLCIMRTNVFQTKYSVYTTLQGGSWVVSCQNQLHMQSSRISGRSIFRKCRAVTLSRKAMQWECKFLCWLDVVLFQNPSSEPPTMLQCATKTRKNPRGKPAILIASSALYQQDRQIMYRLNPSKPVNCTGWQKASTSWQGHREGKSKE